MKLWTEPEIKSLDMQETFGGPNNPQLLDGEVEWDPATGRWMWPAGES